MTKRLHLLLITLLAFLPQLMAEPKEPTAEMLKELQEFKIKYLIQEMDLPTEKQAEFAKIYTQYENERAALFREFHRDYRSIKNNANPTDTEYTDAAESMATAKYREGDLEKRYFNKLNTILNPKQLYIMKCSEKKFDHKLRQTKGKGTKSKAKSRK